MYNEKQIYLCYQMTKHMYQLQNFIIAMFDITYIYFNIFGYTMN